MTFNDVENVGIHVGNNVDISFSKKITCNHDSKKLHHTTPGMFDEPKHLWTLYALHSRAPLRPQQIKLGHQCEVKVAPNLTRHVAPHNRLVKEQRHEVKTK